MAKKSAEALKRLPPYDEDTVYSIASTDFYSKVVEETARYMREEKGDRYIFDAGGKEYRYNSYGHDVDNHTTHVILQADRKRLRTEPAHAPVSAYAVAARSRNNSNNSNNNGNNNAKNRRNAAKARKTRRRLAKNHGVSNNNTENE